MNRTNLDALKKLAAELGVEASDTKRCRTNRDVLNVISAAIGGSRNAVTNAEAIGNIAENAGKLLNPEGMIQLEFESTNADGIKTHATTFTLDGYNKETKSIEKRAFCQLKELKSVVLPEGVETIGAGAFDCCFNLANVTLPKTLKFLENSVFMDCRSIQELALPEGLKSIGTYALAYMHSLKKLVIPKSVTYIAASAFDEPYLTEIEILSPSVQIDAEAFSCIDYLIEEGLPHLTTINIHAPENSIAGAPWGATGAIVNWLGYLENTGG